jgi:hypothetical protein
MEDRVMAFKGKDRGHVKGLNLELVTVSDLRNRHRGVGAAIAAVTILPLAVNVESASAHESKLAGETLAGSFSMNSGAPDRRQGLRRRPARRLESRMTIQNGKAFPEYVFARLRSEMREG